MILIADRIRAMGDMLARRFDADGLPARAVSDTSELLQLVAQGNTRAIVLDPMLPGNAGLGALARIRATPAAAALPVLVLSTNDAPEALDAAKRAGASDYAVKGRETPTQLVVRVRRMLGEALAATPYYLSVRVELGDAPRLARDLRSPGLRCLHCRETLALALEGDPAAGRRTLTGAFTCRRCARRATPPPAPSPVAAAPLELILGEEAAP